MASLSDLFKQNKSDDRPRPPKWENVGDHHDLVVSGEPFEEPQKEVGGSWEPLYIEKQTNGTWKKKIESDLIEGRDHFALTQIVVLGKLHSTGEPSVFYFDNKTKKEALQDAMAKVDLADGYAIRMTRLDNVGKMYGWKVQIAPPKADA